MRKTSQSVRPWLAPHQEQPASGAEERGHAEESDAAAGALTWQELFSGCVGGHYEAGRGGFGRWFRKDRRASGGWGGGGKRTGGERRGRPMHSEPQVVSIACSTHVLEHCPISILLPSARRRRRARSLVSRYRKANVLSPFQAHRQHTTRGTTPLRRCQRARQ